MKQMSDKDTSKPPTDRWVEFEKIFIRVKGFEPRREDKWVQDLYFWYAKGFTNGAKATLNEVAEAFGISSHDVEDGGEEEYV